MPNICENVIEIQGTLKNVEKLLDTCKTVGHEGRFDNNESIEVYDLTLGREMPSEFHTIATGGNTINGVKVDKWEYVHKETGEAFPNGLEAMQNEDLEAVAVSEELAKSNVFAEKVRQEVIRARSIDSQQQTNFEIESKNFLLTEIREI